MLRKKEGVERVLGEIGGGDLQAVPLADLQLVFPGFHGRRVLVGPELERREALKIVDRWIDDLCRSAAG